MTDARWRDAFADVAHAGNHFSRAVQRFSDFPVGNPDAEYEAAMAFMHMMQSGHTSAEAALRRVLGILGEELPTGPESHARLIDRCSEAIEGGRPAIVSPALKGALNETRQFRHVAMHAYASLDRRKAQFAVEAAEVVVGRLETEIAAFREALDPTT